MSKVVGIGRSPNGCYCPYFGDAVGDGEHCRPAQRVPDQKRWCRIVCAEKISGVGQIVNVGAEVGVGEVAPRLAQPGEVESEDRDSEVGQGSGDPGGREHVFTAGEAVRKQGIRSGYRVREVQPRGQWRPLGPGEFQSLALLAHFFPSLSVILGRGTGSHRAQASGRSGQCRTRCPRTSSRSRKLRGLT